MEIPGAEERRREIEQIDQQYPHIYRLIIGIILVLIATVFGTVFVSDQDGYITNLFTELLSIGATVLILDTLANMRADRHLKAQLIREMNSKDNGIAVRAIAEMQAHGWGFGNDKSLENQGFVGVNWTNANLSEANLTGTFITFIDLSEAILLQANLSGANLWHANLESAGLLETNFEGAKLQEANLQKAHAGSASFRNANMFGADLYRATLWSADFRGANMQYADLAEADLYNILEKEQVPLFDENTILPDGKNWEPGVDLERFTNPIHPDFWRSDESRMASCKRRFSK